MQFVGARPYLSVLQPRASGMDVRTCLESLEHLEHALVTLAVAPARPIVGIKQVNIFPDGSLSAGVESMPAWGVTLTRASKISLEFMGLVAHPLSSSIPDHLL